MAEAQHSELPMIKGYEQYYAPKPQSQSDHESEEPFNDFVEAEEFGESI